MIHDVFENQSVLKELSVHGPRFASLFDGYFSNPDVAKPLVEAAERAISVTRPDAIADLGGGMGFILEELLRRGLQGVRLVNVEVSPKQLSVCNNDRIEIVQASMDKVTRSQLQVEDEKLMLIARSVLHYFGRLGIDPLLRHLHGQLRPGEYFVHQSAAFQSQRDADVMNHLYARMGTEKWFFTVDELKSKLEDADFIVHEVIPAPRLEMISIELGERYGLSPEQRGSIGREIEKLFGRNMDVSECDGNGFKAFLHASIFTCEAT